ncbi:MAG: hypothetical protein AB7S26_40310 [Sandaracinaceae bacterium]
MGIDIHAQLELASDPHGASSVSAARFDVRRDYELFDLLAGGRSDDPDDAVVPVRRFRHPGATEIDPRSTWVWRDELAQVMDAYRRSRGVACEDLATMIAAMDRINGDDPRRCRAAFWFF